MPVFSTDVPIHITEELDDILSKLLPEKIDYKVFSTDGKYLLQVKKTPDVFTQTGELYFEFFILINPMLYDAFSFDNDITIVLEQELMRIKLEHGEYDSSVKIEQKGVDNQYPIIEKYGKERVVRANTLYRFLIQDLKDQKKDANSNMLKGNLERYIDSLKTE